MALPSRKHCGPTRRAHGQLEKLCFESGRSGGCRAAPRTREGPARRTEETTESAQMPAAGQALPAARAGPAAQPAGSDARSPRPQPPLMPLNVVLINFRLTEKFKSYREFPRPPHPASPHATLFPNQSAVARAGNLRGPRPGHRAKPRRGSAPFPLLPSAPGPGPPRAPTRPPQSAAAAPRFFPCLLGP